MTHRIAFPKHPKRVKLPTGAVERRWKARNAPLAVLQVKSQYDSTTRCYLVRCGTCGEYPIMPIHRTLGGAFRHAQEVFRGMHH